MKSLSALIALLFFCGCITETQTPTTTTLEPELDFEQVVDSAVTGKPLKEYTTSTIAEKTTTVKETTTTDVPTTTIEKVPVTTLVVIQNDAPSKTSTTLIVKDIVDDVRGSSSSSTSDDAPKIMGGDCVDSDSGLDTNSAGWITVKGKTLSDRCDGNAIIEQFCDDGKGKELRIICANGCLEGVCNGRNSPSSGTTSI